MKRFRCRSFRTITWSRRSRRHCANPALGYAILPRTAETGSLWLDAKALYGIDDFSIEIASAIKDQILGCGVVGKCLTELLNDPCAGWMPGHIAVKNAPPVVRDDEEAVQHTECQRRDGEKIHGCDRFAMVAQERRPSLRRLRVPSVLFCIQRNTVRSEISKPSILSSP